MDLCKRSPTAHWSQGSSTSSITLQLSVSKAFRDHWAYVYEPPVFLPAYNGPPWTAMIFPTVCTVLGLHKIFTTAYHPQTNAHVERLNRTCLCYLRGYASKRQDDWDEYTSAVTFACNCSVCSSLGMPFELNLTPPFDNLRKRPTYT
jgi:transposase InsO family protein